MNGTDTIHDWLAGKYGRNLFFRYDLASAEISRPFFLYYMKKIKDYKLSNTAGTSAPILMVLDELDKMTDGGKTADWDFFQAANLGREYGLQILLLPRSLYPTFMDLVQILMSILQAVVWQISPILSAFRPEIRGRYLHFRHSMVLTTGTYYISGITLWRTDGEMRDGAPSSRSG